MSLLDFLKKKKEDEVVTSTDEVKTDTEDEKVETPSEEKPAETEKKEEEKIYVTPAQLNGVVMEMVRYLNDKAHPVGSVYMTFSDENPESTFGGKWEKLENRFLLGSGAYYPGLIGGNAVHTLTENELPRHSHDKGTMNIYGSFRATSDCMLKNGFEQYFGAFNFNEKESSGIINSPRFGGDYAASRTVRFDASRNWTGRTSEEGGNGAFEIMPPYMVVHMWKRVS